MLSLLGTVFCFAALVLVHELGHFVAARWAKARVTRFSIFLGRPLLRFRRGVTEYTIGWLPIGGFVAIEGMDPEDAEKGPHTFASKTIRQRAVIISAGVATNALTAFLLLAAIPLVVGMPAPPKAALAGVEAAHLPAGAEAWAGLPAGEVVRANGAPVADWSGLITALRAAPGGTVTLEFEGGLRRTLPLPEDTGARRTLLRSLRIGGSTRIGEVVGGSPAAAAGLRAGDVVVAVDGRPVSEWGEVQQATVMWAADPVQITVRRGTETHTFRVVPEAQRKADALATGTIGLLPVLPRERAGLVEAARFGAETTARMVTTILRFLGRLVTGEQGLDGLGGPVAVVHGGSKMAAYGPVAYLAFLAFLSINLAIANLLPLPVLDGGHLVFLAIEAARRRPLPRAARERLTTVGMWLLVGLVLVGFANDIYRLVKGVLA